MNGTSIFICYFLMTLAVLGTVYVASVTFKEVYDDCAVYVRRAMVIMRRKRIVNSPLVVKCSFVTAVFMGVVAKVIKSQL